MIHSEYDILGFSSCSGWEIIINWIKNDKVRPQHNDIIGWAIVVTGSSNDDENSGKEYENTTIDPVFIGPDGIPIALGYFIDEYGKFLEPGNEYNIKKVV